MRIIGKFAINVTTKVGKGLESGSMQSVLGPTHFNLGLTILIGPVPWPKIVKPRWMSIAPFALKHFSDGLFLFSDLYV